MQLVLGLARVGLPVYWFVGWLVCLLVGSLIGLLVVFGCFSAGGKSSGVF